MDLFDNNIIKAAIFDLDGTLINSMGIWRRLLPEFLEARALKAPDNMLSRVAFMTLTQSSQYVADSFPELSMTGKQVKEAWMAIVYGEYAEKIELKSGAADFIKKLKQNNVKIAVATACSKNLAEVCLKNNGIYDMIDTVTYAEDIGCGKDSPRIYLECLNKLGCEAAEAVLFEDILMALKTAGEIGLKTIIVEDESAARDREDLKRSAYKYIKDFTELL